MGLRQRFKNNHILYLAFGIYEGKDISRIGAFLASLDPFAIVHGFDSFEGLPEDWANGKKMQRGTFSVNGEAPQLDKVRRQLDLGNRDQPLENIQFHKGWFHETLPPFLEEHSLSPAVAFVHADSDLYSSTIIFLEALCKKRLFKKGSVLVFDEYWNYENWKDGEYRAWMDVVREYDIQFRYVGYHAPKDNDRNTYGYQSVCVMVTKDM